MKKSLKTILALSLALTTGIGTVYAADGENQTADGINIPLKKTVTRTEEEALYPNATFKFTITPQDGSPANLLTFDDNKDSIEFTNDDQSGDKTLTLKVAQGETLANVIPGDYKYTVAETAGEVDGITYDTTSKTVTVRVYNNTDVEGNLVDGKSAIAIVEGAEGSDPTKLEEVSFENKYETHKVEVKKIIEGNAADLTKEFTFTITINGSKGEKYTVKNGETTAIITSGTPYEVDLGNNETVEIYGLSASDTYTVTEDAEGYTSTGTVEEATAIGKEDKNIEVTNTKTQVIPTGIIENVAPFALALVVGGSFAVIYFKKNRQEA